MRAIVLLLALLFGNQLSGESVHVSLHGHKEVRYDFIFKGPICQTYGEIVIESVISNNEKLRSCNVTIEKVSFKKRDDIAEKDDEVNIETLSESLGRDFSFHFSFCYIDDGLSKSGNVDSALDNIECHGPTKARESIKSILKDTSLFVMMNIFPRFKEVNNNETFLIPRLWHKMGMESATGADTGDLARIPFKVQRNVRRYTSTLRQKVPYENLHSKVKTTQLISRNITMNDKYDLITNAFYNVQGGTEDSNEKKIDFDYTFDVKLTHVLPFGAVQATGFD